MEAFRQLDGRAIPFGAKNVDTDVIIPSHWLKTITRDGLGKGALKAVVREKQIVQRMMLPIAISYDHRVIDGGAAARFTVDLLAAIEGFKEADVTL